MLESMENLFFWKLTVVNGTLEEENASTVFFGTPSASQGEPLRGLRKPSLAFGTFRVLSLEIIVSRVY